MFALLDEFFSLTATELVKYVPNTLHPMNDETYRIATEFESILRLINSLSDKVHGMTMFLFPLKLRSDWQDEFDTRDQLIRNIISKRIDDTYKNGFESIAIAINAIEESLNVIRDEIQSSNGVLSESSFETICDKNAIINTKWNELCNHNAISMFGRPMTGYNVIETILSDSDYARYRIRELRHPMTKLYKELFGSGIPIIGFGEGELFIPCVNSKFCECNLDYYGLLILFNNWHKDMLGENHPAYDYIFGRKWYHRDIKPENILLDDKDDYSKFVNAIDIFLNIHEATPFMRAIIHEAPCGNGVWNVVRRGVLQLRRIDSEVYSYQTQSGNA